MSAKDGPRYPELSVPFPVFSCDGSNTVGPACCADGRHLAERLHRALNHQHLQAFGDCLQIRSGDHCARHA